MGGGYRLTTQRGAVCVRETGRSATGLIAWPADGAVLTLDGQPFRGRLDVVTANGGADRRQCGGTGELPSGRPEGRDSRRLAGRGVEGHGHRGSDLRGVPAVPESQWPVPSARHDRLAGVRGGAGRGCAHELGDPGDPGADTHLRRATAPGLLPFLFRRRHRGRHGCLRPGIRYRSGRQGRLQPGLPARSVDRAADAPADRGRSGPGRVSGRPRSGHSGPDPESHRPDPSNRSPAHPGRVGAGGQAISRGPRKRCPAEHRLRGARPTGTPSPSSGAAPGTVSA